MPLAIYISYIIGLTKIAHCDQIRPGRKRAGINPTGNNEKEREDIQEGESCTQHVRADEDGQRDDFMLLHSV